MGAITCLVSEDSLDKMGTWNCECSLSMITLDVIETLLPEFIYNI